MLRYTKYCAMGLFLIVVLFSLSPSSYAAVQAVQTYTESSWSNTIYYFGTVSGYYGQSQGYQDVTLHITAVDNYELYVNGTQYNGANDGNWRTVDDYNINLGGASDIVIGVKVTNNGLGNGNGLIIGIDAGTDQVGTSTRIRDSQDIGGTRQNVPVAWWTLDEEGFEALEFGDDWYVYDYSKFFTDDSNLQYMERAMLGTINGELDDSFVPGIEVITGYLRSDADIGMTAGGGISLRRIEGENIAHDKPSEVLQYTDGVLGTGQSISGALNKTRYLDLGAIYSINKMTIFTGQSDPTQYPRVSLRGFSVEVSYDQYRWEEVGIIHEIGIDNEGGYDNYSVEFPPEWSRFIRFKVTETRQEDPQIGEVMVFGEGYSLEGAYESPWLDLGTPDAYKNFDMIEWAGDLPDGTEITIQTMTKAGADADESGWSAPVSEQSAAFKSPEPATHFKYRVNLKTQDLNVTPVLTELKFTYSAVDQPVTFAEGFVAPNLVPMAEESEFLYTLDYDLAAGQSISDLAIAVPSYSSLNWVYSTDAADTLSVSSRSAIDTLYVTFNTPLTDLAPGGPDTLRVSFDSSLLRSSHSFEAFLFNAGGNDGAGGIRAWENTDLGSNTVVVSTLVEGILDEVQAIPIVFTPNNDNTNDFTVIEFKLAKVETQVLVKIYSTDGSLVTTLHDDILRPSDYNAPGDAFTARTLPGYWNGQNEDGDLVPPGIYIYQVVAETDNEDVMEGGTVVVAY